MAEIIRMPKMSDTMEEGVLVKWLKKEGDAIQSGDILAEVETDKAVMELENYEEGELLHIAIKEGDKVPVNGLLAIVGSKGEDFRSLLSAEQDEVSSKAASTTPHPEVGASALSSDEDTSPPFVADGGPILRATTSSTQVPDSTPRNRTKASPLAKKNGQRNGLRSASNQWKRRRRTHY